VVLNRNPKWRDSGERLLREMDSFDFIEAWDAAVKERQTVPSVTMKRGETNAVGAISKLLNKFGPETVISALQCITHAVTAHLTTAMSKKNAA